MHKKRKKNKKIKKILILLILIIGIGGFIYKYNEHFKFKEILNNKIEKKEEKEQETKPKEEKIEIKDNDIKKSIFKDYYDKAIKTVEKMTLEEKIGQLFLVRYNKEDVDNLSSYYPGGYILFSKDFENHTKQSMKEEIENVNKKNKYPLIIGVDEEGGLVTRVSRFKEYREDKFLSPKEYYQQGGYELLEKMENEKATLLKELGINLNLAPVADISTNSSDFIYNRSFGEDAIKTQEFIKNMVTYANNNKINSCLKHFPGYGNNIDTHNGVAIDERSYESIKENDYLPFKTGIENNVPSILVSHNIVKSIDDKYPSSLSEKVISELRNTLNFTGIIITDDLAMDAVKSYVENNTSATLAINAGNDMLITSDFKIMYNEVLESVKNNTIKEETINKAVLRVIAWKYYSNLF